MKRRSVIIVLVLLLILPALSFAQAATIELLIGRSSLHSRRVKPGSQRQLSRRAHGDDGRAKSALAGARTEAR